jgi:alpha/beta hydrolase fold
MSPAADLTLAGSTMETKRDVDSLMSRDNLQSRVTDYTAGQDAALGLISPIFADLSGLPPLIIQAGTHEVLLDDAVRLAQQAGTADVEATLDITTGVPQCSKASIRSSTKRPLHWTEPDSSCRRISPARNASPHSERQNARDDGPRASRLQRLDASPLGPTRKAVAGAHQILVLLQRSLERRLAVTDWPAGGLDVRRVREPGTPRVASLVGSTCANWKDAMRAPTVVSSPIGVWGVSARRSG